MSHKLVIIVEITAYNGDSQRVKKEFQTDLNPVAKTHIKLMSGPPRFLNEITETCWIPSHNKMFDGIVSSNNISYFPEENTITVVFYDSICQNDDSMTKFPTFVTEYVKHGWEKIVK